MADLIKTDRGFMIDESDESSTTPGDSGAQDIGIYNIKDFVTYFPEDVTNVQDALFSVKEAATGAAVFGQLALLISIKKDANFATNEDVDGQPALSLIIESNQGTALPIDVKLIGVAVRIPEAWSNTEVSSIVANIGFTGQLTSLATAIDLTAANPNAGTGVPFQATGPMNWVMNTVGGLIPTIQIVSANNLTSILTGSIGVDIFYASV